MTTYLQSRRGTVKSVKEWKEECLSFYKDLGQEEVKDQWGRFQRIIGLQPVGDGKEREWDNRKPVRAQREGLTLTGYEHD